MWRVASSVALIALLVFLHQLSIAGQNAHTKKRERNLLSGAEQTRSSEGRNVCLRPEADSGSFRDIADGLTRNAAIRRNCITASGIRSQ
jgi:hypothetical protein